MRNWCSFFIVLGLAQTATTPPPSNKTIPHCDLASQLVRMAHLPEASGVAASRRFPGVLWAHNDSGPPVLFALGKDGMVRQRIRVDGARVEDWEDIAVGPCERGTCVYIADIGDNDGSRERITIYQIPEPAPDLESTAPAESYHATYPDGAHDAEALFVTPDADVYILTKGDPGPVALYQFPKPLNRQQQMRLNRVGSPRAQRNVESGDRPTAADASSDGRFVALRTTAWIEWHRTSELTAGRWNAVARQDLRSLSEPRGEGLALGSDGTVFLVGEGRGSAGTFVRLTCTVPP